MLRRFYFQRDIDETGISGTGKVAEGVVFPNGKCAFSWNTKIASVVIYDSIEDAITVHSHGGKTKIIFVDEEVIK